MDSCNSPGEQWCYQMSYLMTLVNVTSKRSMNKGNKFLKKELWCRVCRGNKVATIKSLKADVLSEWQRTNSQLRKFLLSLLPLFLSLILLESVLKMTFHQADTYQQILYTIHVFSSYKDSFILRWTSKWGSRQLYGVQNFPVQSLVQ